MGFGQLTRTQRVLLLRHIRNTDRDLYDYIRTIRKMKKILPVICGNGDVQAIRATQVAGTPMTVGNIVGASSDTSCKTCEDACYDAYLYNHDEDALMTCIEDCYGCI